MSWRQFNNTWAMILLLAFAAWIALTAAGSRYALLFYCGAVCALWLVIAWVILWRKR